MTINSFKDLAEHVGHNIECTMYGDNEEVVLECTTCQCILIGLQQHQQVFTVYKTASRR